jgi:undecaprenyl-diphosphatase
MGIYFARTSDPSSLDERLRAVVTVPSGLWSASITVDAAGEPVGAIALILTVGLICAALGRWRLAMLTVAGQAVIGATTGAIKPLFDRTIHGPYLSYPSGHTASAVGFGLVVGLLVADLVEARHAAGLGIVLGIAGSIGLLAALAQIYLDAHYATDTIGGIATGCALVVLTGLVLDRTCDRTILLLARSFGPPNEPGGGR